MSARDPIFEQDDQSPEALRVSVEELRRELAERDRALQSLRTLVDLRGAMLDALLNSRGWRLLEVLRGIRTLIKKRVLASLVPRRLQRRQQIDGALYRRWIEMGREKRVTAEGARKAIVGFHYRPRISIIMPVYNTRRDYLGKAFESVRAQYYGDWELCVCDDGSSEAHVRPALEKWARRDARVKVVFSPANEGISAASNRALELASGEFVGLLDHDDELTPDALFEVVKLLQDHADADVVYSDEDKLEADGGRCDPFFKPDWSPEYLLSCMYTCHFGVYRRALMERLGGFRQGFEGSQDYDLMLRLSERTERIFHVAKVLYHWRKTGGSTSVSAQRKRGSFDAGKRALQEHMERRGVEAVVSSTRPNRFRVRPAIIGEPLVSIIIPTKNQARLLARCVDSIERKSTYARYEIIVVDNGSSEPAMRELSQRTRHKVVTFAEAFNFSRINNFGVRHAGGEYLVFLNDDTAVRSPEWLEAMLELCQLPGVGSVGPKLLFPTGRVQHAGVVLGMGGAADHPFYGEPGQARGYFDILQTIRNCSAVSAACCMVRRKAFEQVGGFDETLPVNFNDVDFCIRLLKAGYRVVWTPFAELYHHESASRPRRVKAEEICTIHERWGELLFNDPHYNPNLTLYKRDYSLRW